MIQTSLVNHSLRKAAATSIIDTFIAEAITTNGGVPASPLFPSMTAC